jgi:hypothetical protein
MASRGRKALLERQDKVNPELLDRKAHKDRKDHKALQERLALTAKTAMALRAPILPLTAR